jgi:copper chaperone CopZ
MKRRFSQIVLTAIVTLLLASVALAADATTTFKVTGMYCSACETKIQQALKRNDDAKVKPDQIVKVIEKEGYKAEPQQQKAK